MLRIVLVSKSKLATPAVLQDMCRPLAEGARHAWEAWHRYLPDWMADAPPHVMLWGASALAGWDHPDIGGMVRIVFTDGRSRNDNTLAVHFVANGRPEARVYVDASSGLNTGRTSACESASHEIAEIIANPWITEWVDAPGQPGLYVARENADPVQTSYPSSFKDPSGKPWQLANIATPWWFGMPCGMFDVDGRPVYDLGHELGYPGEIGPEGYLILRDSNWRVTHAFGSEALAVHGATPGKPGGRSEAIRLACAREQKRRRKPVNWLRRMLGRPV